MTDDLRQQKIESFARNMGKPVEIPDPSQDITFKGRCRARVSIVGAMHGYVDTGDCGYLIPETKAQEFDGLVGKLVAVDLRAGVIDVVVTVRNENKTLSNPRGT